MAFVGFGDNGFDYFNKNNCILFSSDNTHNYLFDYVANDLSCLPKLLEQYVSKRIDTTTFELVKYKNSDEDIIKIKEILISAHPYYKYEYKKAIVKAIGDYYNKLLIYSVFHKKSLTFDCTLEEEWYYQKFHCLISSSLTGAGSYPDGLFPLDFYHKYKAWVGAMGYRKGEIDETFIPNIPSKMPVGFSEELQTQTTIRNLLYFLLDVSAQNIEKLTTSQRVWLYGNMFHKSKKLSEMHVTRKLLFRPPSLYSEKDQAEDPYFLYMNENLKKDDKMNDLFRTLGTLDIVDNGIPTNMINSFNYVIEYAKAVNTTKIYEEYEINNLQELLYLEIIDMVQSETLIKKCENCNKYFVRNDKKKKYCDRIDESGMICSKVAKKKRQEQKYKNDPALKLYHTAYKTHHARRKKGNLTQQEFLLWQEKAQTKLEQVRNGDLDISFFEKWLKK